MDEQVPDGPTLAEYEQYIRKQVAAEPCSTYARGVVRDLLAEVDRLRAMEQRARELGAGRANGPYGQGVNDACSSILGET